MCPVSSGGTLDRALLLSSRDSVLDPGVGQPGDSRDEVPVVGGCGRDLRDEVCARASAGEEQVAHTGVDCADHDGPPAIRVWIAVFIVGDVIAVRVRERPAYISQELERQIVGRLHLVREIIVAERLHQQIAPRDLVVVRDRRAAANRSRRVHPGSVQRIGPDAKGEICEDVCKNAAAQLSENGERVGAPQAHGRDQHERVVHAVLAH